MRLVLVSLLAASIGCGSRGGRGGGDGDDPGAGGTTDAAADGADGAAEDGGGPAPADAQGDGAAADVPAGDDDVGDPPAGDAGWRVVDVEADDVHHDLDSWDGGGDLDLPLDIPCSPSCEGKECGPNGCGGVCGKCPAAAPTCEGGLCKVVCQPSCGGKECGPDGCGGHCGKCPAAAPLCEEGQCTVVPKPSCDGKECGPDGAGGTCGTCGGNETCTLGKCVVNGGACNNPSDLAAIEAQGAGGMLQVGYSCGTQCLGMGVTCAGPCIVGATGLSGACSDCFVEAITCGVGACLGSCLPSPGEACASCIADQCGAAFEDCAGITAEQALGAP